MNNPYDLLYTVREQQLYRQREADRFRQSRLARLSQLQEQSSGRANLKQRLGQQLITLGQRLSQTQAVALDEA